MDENQTEAPIGSSSLVPFQRCSYLDPTPHPSDHLSQPRHVLHTSYAANVLHFGLAFVLHFVLHSGYGFRATQNQRERFGVSGGQGGQDPQAQDL